MLVGRYNVTADDIGAPSFDHDLSREPPIRHLILDHDLVLAWLDKSSVHVDVLLRFELSILFLLFTQSLPAFDLVGNAILRHVHSQHILVTERCNFTEAAKPVRVGQIAELAAELACHALRNC